MEQLYIWLFALGLILVVFVPYLLKFRRSQKETEHRRKEAKELGIDRPRAQYPQVNRTLCIGCGSCVQACPEGDVLGVVWGAAEVINGERCVGHGFCEMVCPVGAIKVGLGDIKSRPDIPVLSEKNETTVPGLFIAGELSGISLIRHAISQGRMVVDEIARRRGKEPWQDGYDVIIVGAGPAGLSAALSAIAHGLRYLVLEQSDVGGTISHYPRRKLVMTQPVEIPLYGWLKKEEYSKEFLLDAWYDIVSRFQVNIATDQKVERIERLDGRFQIKTAAESYRAEAVVLAMGRRGSPRKLDVPGEELPKVMYQLVDAQSYSDKAILVVGGGDSAVEAAVGLARQKGNQVTISYRKKSFFRIKKKNEEKLKELIKEKKIKVLFESQVKEIRPDSVVLKTPQGETEIPNEYVIIQAGGIPPFEMLRQCGIAFGGDAISFVEADRRFYQPAATA